MEKMQIKCESCEALNEIDVKRLYDAYEGSFNCKFCREPLDIINNITDEGTD